MSEYVLGTSDHELERLALQQEVWEPITAGFLDRLRIQPGWRVLDLGCGPGFVLEMLRERVGSDGEVVGLDESGRWIELVRERAREHGWSNVTTRAERIQDASFAPGSFDLVFTRWFLGFLPEPDEIVRRLAASLRSGGVLAVMDYNHEGVSVFPPSPGFQAVVRATRELYAARGGDTWIIGRANEMFRTAGLEPFVFAPYVIGGGPDSPAFRWADAFFPFHADGMVEAGVLSPAERQGFLTEWSERKANPTTLFFSPIVAGAAARRST